MYLAVAICKSESPSLTNGAYCAVGTSVLAGGLLLT